MAYIVMVYIVMAYIVMAYEEPAHQVIDLLQASDLSLDLPSVANAFRCAEGMHMDTHIDMRMCM